ncbi:MAG: site-specific integrase, partial [Bacteroidota bacterium]
MGSEAGAMWEDLEQWLSARYSAKSLASYRYAIGRYLAWIGDGAKGATYADILTYLASLRTLHLRPRTLNNYLFAVKLYYHFLRDTGQRDDHPCQRLRLRDAVDRGIRIDELYPPEELEALLQSGASKVPGLTARNRVVLSLLIHQALLVSELVRLRIDDLDLTAGTVYVSASVSNLARTLPLLPEQI